MLSTDPGAIPASETRNSEAEHERWAHWPVNWSAIVIGSLTAVVLTLLFGLVALATGAHLVGAEHRVVDIRSLGIAPLVIGICGAFFSFVAGGWVAGKVA